MSRSFSRSIAVSHSTRSLVRAKLLGRTLRCEPLEDRRMLSVGAGGENALQLFSTSTALFVENQGQWSDEAVRYGFQGDGVNIAFTDEGLGFVLSQPDVAETSSHRSWLRHPAADCGSGILPQSAAGSYSHVDCAELGVGDVANHRSNVAGYTTVAYENLYTGIDLHTFGRRDSLKYEFYVAPGADYRQISVSYDGIDGLWIDDHGALHVKTELGQLVDDAPYIYQTVGGQEADSRTISAIWNTFSESPRSS